MYQHEKQQRLIELDELGITFGTPIDTVCPSCSRPLDAFGLCPGLSQADARRGISFCSKGQDEMHPESCSCTRCCHTTRKLLD
jgi:hypothetical protein